MDKEIACAKIYGLLGLAQKAGQVKSGGNTCQGLIKTGRARLVLIAEDTASGTMERYLAWCRAAHVPYYIWGEKAGLGQSLGKGERSLVVVLDPKLAARLTVYLRT